MSNYEACVAAAAQITSALAANTSGGPDEQKKRALETFDALLKIGQANLQGRNP